MPFTFIIFMPALPAVASFHLVPGSKSGGHFSSSLPQICPGDVKLLGSLEIYSSETLLPQALHHGFHFQFEREGSQQCQFHPSLPEHSCDVCWWDCHPGVPGWDMKGSLPSHDVCLNLQPGAASDQGRKKVFSPSQKTASVCFT